jgi:hypothetical protein
LSGCRTCRVVQIEKALSPIFGIVGGRNVTRSRRSAWIWRPNKEGFTPVSGPFNVTLKIAAVAVSFPVTVRLYDTTMDARRGLSVGFVIINRYVRLRCSLDIRCGTSSGSGELDTRRSRTRCSRSRTPGIGQLKVTSKAVIPRVTRRSRWRCRGAIDGQSHIRVVRTSLRSIVGIASHRIGLITGNGHLRPGCRFVEERIIIGVSYRPNLIADNLIDVSRRIT